MTALQPSLASRMTALQPRAAFRLGLPQTARSITPLGRGHVRAATARLPSKVPRASAGAVSCSLASVHLGFASDLGDLAGEGTSAAEFMPSIGPGDVLLTLKDGGACLAKSECLELSAVLTAALASAKQEHPAQTLLYIKCAA